MLRKKRDELQDLKNNIVEPNTEKVNFPPELLKNKLMKLILKTNKDNQICKFCNQAINPLQKNNNNVLI